MFLPVQSKAIQCFVAVWFLCRESSCALETASFDILLGTPTSPFPHVWEESVGSGHMALALRADWRAQLTRAHADIGFKRVRMHGMLDDDMSVSLGPARPDLHPPIPGGYSFVSLNSVVDFLTSIGMDAFFEVGFMPRWLAANTSDTVMHYRAYTSPPRNYTEWGEVVETVARHLYDRYGEEAIEKWFFEVWNEPNIHFWTGTPQQATYFDLYKETHNAFRRVSPKFRIGGPASSGLVWLPEFLNFCNESGVGRPDFVSTHSYAGGDKGSIYQDLTKGLQKAHAQADGVPLVISEYGGSWAHVDQLDEPAYAAFIVRTAATTQNLTDVMSLWAFSDVFEENGFPAGNVTYSAGFGLMNVYGVPKPSYRSMQLLHWAGDERVPVARRNDDCATVDVLALVNTTHLALFVTNHAPLPLEGVDPVKACNVRLAFPQQLDSPALVARIDALHVNPKKTWEAMGYPPYPTPKQLAILEAASEFKLEPLSADADGALSLSLPRGLAVVFVPRSDTIQI